MEGERDEEERNKGIEGETETVRGEETERWKEGERGRAREEVEGCPRIGSEEER